MLCQPTMNKKQDGNSKDDVQSILKKLHALELKLDQMSPFLRTRDSGGSGEKKSAKKSRLPVAPDCSGVKLKNCKSIKKGFITWPTEDDESTATTDRVSYVMNRWESQSSNGKKYDLFSEPSDFVDQCDVQGDRRMDSKVCSLSIKESSACIVSKIKNSQLKS